MSAPRTIPAPAFLLAAAAALVLVIVAGVLWLRGSAEPEGSASDLSGESTTQPPELSSGQSSAPVPDPRPSGSETESLDEFTIALTEWVARHGGTTQNYASAVFNNLQQSLVIPPDFYVASGSPLDGAGLNTVTLIAAPGSGSGSVELSLIEARDCQTVVRVGAIQIEDSAGLARLDGIAQLDQVPTLGVGPTFPNCASVASPVLDRIFGGPFTITLTGDILELSNDTDVAQFEFREGFENPESQIELDLRAWIRSFDNYVQQLEADVGPSDGFEGLTALFRSPYRIRSEAPRSNVTFTDSCAGAFMNGTLISEDINLFRFEPDAPGLFRGPQVPGCEISYFENLLSFLAEPFSLERNGTSQRMTLTNGNESLWFEPIQPSQPDRQPAAAASIELVDWIDQNSAPGAPGRVELLSQEGRVTARLSAGDDEPATFELFTGFPGCPDLSRGELQFLNARTARYTNFEITTEVLPLIELPEVCRDETLFPGELLLLESQFELTIESSQILLANEVGSITLAPR